MTGRASLGWSALARRSTGRTSCLAPNNAENQSMNPGWLALALAVLLPLHPRLQARLLRISFERIAAMDRR